MNPSAAQRKTSLRREIQEKLETLSDSQRQEESQRLASGLLDWIPSQHFEFVLATLPLEQEPDLNLFLTAWIEKGGRLALARTGSGRSMEFREVKSLSGPWETKPFGMREPPAAEPLWEPGPRTLALVPGLAFALAKGAVHRLGHGAGYYDRWLAAFRGAVFSLGVGFSCQLVAEVPTEAHDQLLDGWAGPQGVLVQGPIRTADSE